MHPGTDGRRGPGRGRAFTLACVLAAVVPLPVARAQDAGPGDPEMTLSLDSISPWIDDEHPFELEVRLRNLADVPRTGLRVEARLLQPVGSRSQLAAVVDGQDSSTYSSISVDDITVTSSRSVRITADRSQLGSPGLGIYPLSIEVSDVDGAFLEERTAIPVVANAPTTRLRILTAFDVTDPDPPVRLQGGYDPAAIDVGAMRAAADRLDALDGSRPFVAVDGATVEAIADLSDGALTRSEDGHISDLDPRGETAAVAERLLSSLRRIANGGALAFHPYVQVDLSALAALRASSRVQRQFRRAKAAFREILGHGPTRTMFNPDLVDRAWFPVSGALVAPGQLEAVSDAPFLPDLFDVSTPVAIDDTKLIVSDARLTELSRGEAGWVASAQTIIAESALRWLELPLFAGERLLVFQADPLAPPRLLERVAAALRTAPWLRRTLPAQVGEARGAATIPVDTEPVRSVSLAIPAASRALRAIRSVLPEDASEVAVARVDEWETAVLVAERVTEDAIGDEALADAVRRDIQAHLDRLEALPRPEGVTLTSRRGEIPIVLGNGNDFAVEVIVHLTGRRIAFPEGRIFPVRLDPGDTTLGVPVEVLGQGAFPLEVSIATPDGTALTTTTVELRSTRVSRVAAGVVGGALLFLFIQAARKRRKARAS